MRRRDFIKGAAAFAAGAPASRQAVGATPVKNAADAAKLPGGFYNFTGTNLENWGAVLAAQRHGSVNAIIGCLGDSTVAGQGAASNELASNAKSLSWPTQLANLLPDGSWSSVWGDNNVMASAGNLQSFDARLGQWAIAESHVVRTLCGGSFHGYSNAATHSFTPTNAIDTIEVWYARSPANGVFTINVDGGFPLARINCAGQEAFQKATARCPLGFHTINVQRAGADGGDIYLIGLRAYSSILKEVSVYNLGGCRWGSADFVVDSHPWSTLPAMAAIAPNLVIFEAGIINDWDDRIPLSTVKSNVTAVIDTLRSVKCDVILMSGAPSKAGVYASYETQASYVAHMKSLAYAVGVPFIDVWELFGMSWNKRAMYDSLHPNQVGYGMIASYAEMAVFNPSARSKS